MQLKYNEDKVEYFKIWYNKAQQGSVVELDKKSSKPEGRGKRDKERKI